MCKKSIIFVDISFSVSKIFSISFHLFFSMMEKKLLLRNKMFLSFLYHVEADMSEFPKMCFAKIHFITSKKYSSFNKKNANVNEFFLIKMQVWQLKIFNRQKKFSLHELQHKVKKMYRMNSTTWQAEGCYMRYPWQKFDWQFVKTYEIRY